MGDNFSNGIASVIKPLRPKGGEWREVPYDQSINFGFPARAWIHHESGLAVISAVETMSDEDKGPEYHISISKQIYGYGSQRCTSNEANWVLRQFDLDGAEEDNHVPYGNVRNFWRPVANNLVGMECKCKAEEPAIVEDKGDFVWRP